MKRINSIAILVAFALVAMASSTWAQGVQLSATKIKAGSPITVSGAVAPGQDVYIVVGTDKLFKPADALGSKEKKQLRDGKNGKNAFGDTAIPPIYYVITNTPGALATPEESTKGQTSGLFAFPPFKYQVKVNKIKAWDEIPAPVKTQLGPVATRAQWDFIIFTHENKFGINTVSKEAPIGGGNARAIMSDYATHQEAWNKVCR